MKDENHVLFLPPPPLLFLNLAPVYFPKALLVWILVLLILMATLIRTLPSLTVTVEWSQEVHRES